MPRDTAGGTEWAALKEWPGAVTIRGVSSLLAADFELPRGAELTALIVGAALTVVWLLVLGAIRAVRQPKEPEIGPPTLETGPEPPAVANLLTNNWRVTRDAVPATLLDLAARGSVAFEQVAPGQFQVRVLRTDPGDLRPYEHRVMTVLASKAVGGVVPAGALTTGQEEAARGWFKGFTKDVVAEAKARGVSEDLWDPMSKVVAAVAAVGPAVAFGIAYPIMGAVYAALGAMTVLGAVWAGNRQRHTPAGLDAASRWLGVKEHLHTDEVFDTLPPTAVATWEHLLAYGAALGVAAGAVQPISMGAEDDHRAWSPAGGRWRQVRVSYPHRRSPGWGSSPWLVILLSLVRFAAAAGLGWAGVVLNAAADDESAANVARGMRIGAGGADVLAAVLALYSLVQLVRAVADLFLVDRVTGLVLRARRRGSDDNHVYFLAVDDGSEDRIRAWRVRPTIYVRTYEGDRVTATVTRGLGYVRSIEPAPVPVSVPPAGAGFTP